MKFKKIALSSLLAASFALGYINVDTASAAETDDHQLFASVMNLKPGESRYVGSAIVIINYDNAISYSSGYIRALKPGTALVQIYENNQWVDYEVYVSRF